jgi:hypothetical protein
MTIYLEETLNLFLNLGKKDKKQIEDLVESGEIRQLKNIKYLKITQ